MMGGWVDDGWMMDGRQAGGKGKKEGRAEKLDGTGPGPAPAHL